MKFTVEIEVTPESRFPDGVSSLLPPLYLSEEPSAFMKAVLQQVLSEKSPYLEVYEVRLFP